MVGDVSHGICFGCIDMTASFKISIRTKSTSKADRIAINESADSYAQIEETWRSGGNDARFFCFELFFLVVLQDEQ